jgi:hypothetical protein
MDYWHGGVMVEREQANSPDYQQVQSSKRFPHALIAQRRNS